MYSTHITNESEEVRYKDTYKVNADAEFIYIFLADDIQLPDYLY